MGGNGRIRSMNIENSGIQPCPYWMRYVQYGEHILAMCAVKSENDPPYRDPEGLPRRLKECPIYGKRAVILAFEMPGIFELEVSGTSFNETDYAVSSDYSGYGGVFQLEDIWDQEVEKFIERHSKPS